ncbi:MAG: rod shape-determining protein MreC [Niameybacter sp.]|uniref:rod shape-determining protein MreC n=1 Tax=Niameybacter sp. TaxID=2033640 RepID=UPI002FCC1390
MKLSQKAKKKLIIVGISVVAALSVTLVLGVKYNISILSGIADVVTYPFKEGIHFLTNQVKEVGDYFVNVDNLIKENEELKMQNDRLVYQNTMLTQYKGENESLKELLLLKQRYEEYPTVGANVIAKDTSNWYKSFNIDKGLIHSIKEDDVLLSDGGLVGHVTKVNPLSSVALSIIDDRSSISVKVVRTGDTGILRGDVELGSQGLCKLEIDVESEIVKGDQIITSHLSDIYPPGIPIGTVDEVTTGKNGLTQYAYIKPFVDFKHLESVLIISTDDEE